MKLFLIHHKNSTGNGIETDWRWVRKRKVDQGSVSIVPATNRMVLVTQPVDIEAIKHETDRLTVIRLISLTDILLDTTVLNVRKSIIMSI